MDWIRYANNMAEQRAMKRQSRLGMSIAFLVFLTTPALLVAFILNYMNDNAICGREGPNFYVELTCEDMPYYVDEIYTITAIPNRNDLVIEVLSEQTGRDILLWIAKDSYAYPIAANPGYEGDVSVSQDGRFLTYVWDTSGDVKDVAQSHVVMEYDLEWYYPTQLSLDEQFAIHPAAGSNGLVAYSFNEFGNYQIRVVNRFGYDDSGYIIRTGDHSYNSNWSDDGDWLSWENSDGLISFFSLDTYEISHEVPVGVIWGDENCHIHFSRNGKTDCASS